MGSGNGTGKILSIHSELFLQGQLRDPVLIYSPSNALRDNLKLEVIRKGIVQGQFGREQALPIFQQATLYINKQRSTLVMN